MQVQWIADSSSSYRGFNQTTGTVKVVCNDGQGNNSPSNNIQVLLYEGDDDYDHITTYGKPTLQELQDLALYGIWVDIEQDNSTVKRQHVAITLVERGDLKWLNASCGMSGCSADCSCPWCLVTSSEYAACKKATMRDSTFMLKMAHAVVPGVLEAGYKCPGCKKVSVSLKLICQYYFTYAKRCSGWCKRYHLCIYYDIAFHRKSNTMQIMNL